MRIKLLIVVLALMVIVIPFVPLDRVVAIASTYYVAKTGNDYAGDGSISNPWLTIQKGVDELLAGDTLYVRAGTYAERVQMGNLIGSVANWTTISTYNNEHVIIDGTGLYAPVQIFDDEYLIFNGFEIENSTTRWGIGITDENHYITLINLTIHDTQAGAIYASYDDVGYNPNLITHLVIDNCHTYDTNLALTGEAISLVTIDEFEIKDCLVEDTFLSGVTQQAGIDCKYGCTNGSIHNNEMNNVGAGIYIGNINTGETENIDIYSNVIHDCMVSGGQAILLDSETNPITMTNINIYNNIIYGNYRGITVYWEAGIGASTKTFSITNNTFYHNGAAGLTEIYLADATGYVDCVVRNNIIVGSDATTLTLSNKAVGGVTIEYNLFYDAAGYVAQGVNNQDYGSDFIQSDPLLLNPTTDFRIPAGSPAKDAGIDTDAPANDFIGTVRPYNALFDIGAYEYTTTTHAGAGTGMGF